MDTKKKLKSTNIVSKILNILGCTTIVATTCSSIALLFATPLSQEVNKKQLIDNLSSVRSSDEYQSYRNTKLDNAYAEYKDKEIETYEYKNILDKINSDETFIEWARKLQNKNVQSSIADYDKEKQKLDNRQTNNAIATTINIGGLLAISLADHILEKKKNKLEKQLAEEKTMDYIQKSQSKQDKNSEEMTQSIL